MTDEMVRETRSYCRNCRAWVPARLIERGGNVDLDSDCPACGARSRVFKFNSAFYRAIGAFDDHAAPKPLPDTVDGKVNELYLDVVGRCNLTCSICFAGSGTHIASDDPPLDRYLDVLRRIRGPKPILSVLGGEPTLRADLPDFIAEVTRMGFHVKLDTNGIRLADENYLDELVRAGLRTVCLQFDGFDRDAYRAIRGADLLDLKARVLDALVRRDLNIILACMIVPGVNDHQTVPILDYALRTPQVSLIGYLPAANIGRNDVGGEPRRFDLHDFVAFLEGQTGGAIGERDFVRSMRLARLMGRLTGSSDFHVTSCFVGTYVARKSGRFAPVTRLMDPAGFWRAREFAGLLPQAWSVARGRRRCVRRPGILGVVVETYLDHDNLEWVSAHQCPKAYVTPDGLRAVCLYNATLRERPSTPD
ncbi:MAG: radical SAM protein [Deltaproteobacteria bacterium]|nr:radical SAM protein [Deltaproteobacteria bacterium]